MKIKISHPPKRIKIWVQGENPKVGDLIDCVERPVTVMKVKKVVSCKKVDKCEKPTFVLEADVVGAIRGNDRRGKPCELWKLWDYEKGRVFEQYAGL